MARNQLKLNDEKTKFLVFAPPQLSRKISVSQINIGDCAVSSCSAVLMLTFKALNGLAPDYLKECLVEYQPVTSMRSSQHFSLVVPGTRQQLYGDRAFSSVAPRLWNDLPAEIKATTGMEHYKSTIKT